MKIRKRGGGKEDEKDHREDKKVRKEYKKEKWKARRGEFLRIEGIRVRGRGQTNEK